MFFSAIRMCFSLASECDWGRYLKILYIYDAKWVKTSDDNNQNEEMIVHAGEGVFYHLLALSSTEQDANGRVVAEAHLVLQLYDDTAMQNTVVEHKVGIIVLVVNDNALLAGLEAEALAEFEDELLQVSYKCILQVMLIHVFYRIIVTTFPLKSGH